MVNNYYFSTFTGRTMPFTNNFNEEKYYKLAVSVDNIIFGFDEDALKVLLIKRSIDPYKGAWAIPGAMVRLDENLRDAPKRTLKELTGLEDVYLEQVHAFGKLYRHPAGRVITVGYYSLINIKEVKPQPSSFAMDIKWENVNEIKSEDLPFDHFEILETCLKRLRKKFNEEPVGIGLLPEKFTLSMLQVLYETVLNISLDKRNFRKKILSMKYLDEVGEYQAGVAHRPAKLYTFKKDINKDYKSIKQLFSQA